jgi:hypothetical protein
MIQQNRYIMWFVSLVLR